jgi:predicted transcriptional regulator
MTEPVVSQRVLQVIGEQIDTVPQLECLVQLYQHDNRTWLTEEVAGRIYTSQQTARSIIEALQRRGLLAADGDPPRYRYDPNGMAGHELMGQVVAEYQTHVVRIATFIHANASASVREFARAFDLKKDR